jgi:glycosyltransferase involved in cell wall biosynthesis
LCTSNVSVAIFAYNGGLHLREQLGSIGQQSLKPLEVVFCDDCSKESSADIVKSFANNAGFKAVSYQNDNHIGVLANLTKAVALCRGSYIALFEQYDNWKPGKLKKNLEVIQEAEATFGREMPLLVHSKFGLIDEEGKVVVRISKSFERFINGVDGSYSCFKSDKSDLAFDCWASDLEAIENPITEINCETGNYPGQLIERSLVKGSTAMFNRAFAELAFPVPSSAIIYDMWLASVARRHGQIIYIDQKLADCRQQGKEYYYE